MSEVKLKELICREKKSLSKFTKLLISISLGLTQKDIANIKLILICENKLKPRLIDSVTVAGDLLIAMKIYGLISENDVETLHLILNAINQQDLSRLVTRYETQLKYPVEDSDYSQLSSLSSRALQHSENAVDESLFKDHRSIASYAESTTTSGSFTDDEKLSSSQSSQSSEEGATSTGSTTRAVGTQVTTKVRRDYQASKTGNAEKRLKRLHLGEDNMQRMKSNKLN